VPAATVKDPPGWGTGFVQMADRMIESTECRMFASRMPAITEGLAQFAASSLQYSLVSETRDTIGSAAATVLPHQAVIDQRDRSLRALEQYVRESPSPDKLTPEIVCGMLYTLLDRHGFGRHALIDWEPYTRFFEVVKGHPHATDCESVFVLAMNESFGTDLSADFQEWGFRVNKAVINRMAQL
jgi:hypothetical protein